MFVRVKKIKGKRYAYLVENSWVSGRSRQKVKEYLGRVIGDHKTAAPDLSDARDRELLTQVILLQVPEGVRVDIKKRSVTKDGKDVVVGLNNGFLCARTLKDIFSALKKEETRPGLALAKALSQAGIKVDQEDFVRIYLEAHR